jgi:DNA-binding phage protein
MSTIKVKALAADGKPKIITFRRMLLSRIQQLFDSRESDEETQSMLNAIKETHDVSFLNIILHAILYS